MLYRILPIAFLTWIFAGFTSAQETLEDSRDRNASRLEIRLDGDIAICMYDILQAFEETNSNLTRGIAASTLLHLADSNLVTQQLKSNSLQVRTLFSWIKFLRIQPSWFRDESRDMKTRERFFDEVISFVEMVAKNLDVKFPAELRTLVHGDYSEDKWEHIFNESKIKRIEEVSVSNGRLTINNETRAGPILLAELASGREILCHEWNKERLFVALSGSDEHDLEYSEIICFDESRNVCWKRRMNSWSDDPLGNQVFIRMKVSSDSKSIVVFSAFASSFGIECLDIQNGSLTMSFFSCLPELIPLVPGKG